MKPTENKTLWKRETSCGKILDTIFQRVETLYPHGDILVPATVFTFPAVPNRTPSAKMTLYVTDDGTECRRSPDTTILREFSFFSQRKLLSDFCRDFPNTYLLFDVLIDEWIRSQKDFESRLWLSPGNIKEGFWTQIDDIKRSLRTRLSILEPQESVVKDMLEAFGLTLTNPQKLLNCKTSYTVGFSL